LSQVLSWREMTGVGMQINLIQDASVAAAPSGFAATIRAAADVLQQTFRDNVTLNIRFGWGTYNNSVDPALTGSSGSEGGPTAGDAVSYSILRSWLIADASSEADITATGSLPSSNFSLPNNQDSFFVASAQEKALGHFAGSSGTIDGAVGFGTSSTSSFWFPFALHELTHAMGRTTGAYTLPPATGMDLYRYSAPGAFQWAGGQPAYFSIDGGRTRLANFSTVSDYADWATDGLTTNDPFLAFVPSSATLLTATDITMMDVLGFDVSNTVLRLVGPGDFSQNGYNDLAWSRDGNAVLWLNNASAFNEVQVANAHVGSEWTAFGVGKDVTGTTDVVWHNGTGGSAQIWQLRGASLVGAGILQGQMGSEWHVASLGDFNGNGNTDILWESSAGNINVWSLSGLSLESTATSNGQIGADWHIITHGDFYGSGRDGLLWEDPSGDLQSWAMNAAAVTTVANVGHMGSEWRCAGVGSFQNDGPTDVVWVDTNNDVQLWQMSNGVISQFITPSGHDGQEWHLGAIGDFNADGSSDLLWLNNNGAAQIWQINGSQVSTYFASAPSGETLVF